MHGEQQRRSVQEDDREHVEGIVEEVAVADREGSGPIEVREDAERNRLAPAAHQHRPDEAEHEHRARWPRANAQATWVPMPSASARR